METHLQNYIAVKNENLRSLLEVLVSDLGSIVEKFVCDIIDDTSASVVLRTSYATYNIFFDKSDNGVSQSSCVNNSIFRTITIGEEFLVGDKAKVKYFLRRQFIADEQLFNLYLRRGGEIRPNEAQAMALASLSDTRERGANRGVAILATGLGKTILSALDAKNTGSERILFIVHINEILRQTKEVFEKVFPERKNDLGLYNGNEKEKDKKIIFASIQTLGKKKHLETFSPNHFDYIIVDETHHTAAPTYGSIFSYFKPKFFLGLTATPDRMDQKDILGYYNNNIVFEMDQERAIEQGYLAPFKYYGFKDSIDYSDIYYNGFKYDTKDLNKHLLIDERDQAIIKKFNEMAGDRKTIGFCASIEHADRCAAKFNAAGINAISIHSRAAGLDTADDKDKSPLIKYFRDGKCQVAFVVDMFNEGVDIPDVSCLLFLRPTESRTVFVQHMGRGLRISPGKENVLILDFIGNYRTANIILAGLDIKNGIRGLKKCSRDGKDYFSYDLNGCEVVFDAEVIEIFRNNEVLHVNGVRDDIVKDEWREYSVFLQKWTKDNLYWKRGQQNQYFEVNFEALKIIKESPSITEKEFIAKIQLIINEKYPGKNMTAGFRALFISKITGFISSNTPLSTTSHFDAVCKNTKDFSNLGSYQDILTMQLEKILYWNPIYGAYNKYVESAKRVSFRDFKIYPFFFLYDVLISLLDDYGSEPSISRFEFNTFLAVTKEHSETTDVAEKILRLRADEERQQTQKLLQSKNEMDARFYGILHYNKYLEEDKNSIKIKPEYIDEVRERVKRFRELYYSGKLVAYQENSPELYTNMLYSNKDILSYHDEER